MQIETVSEVFRKVRSVNQTSNGYVSKIPTITEPKGDAGTATGSSVIDTGWGGGICQNGFLICPYAIGADAATASVRVIGWRLVGTNANPLPLWIPVLLVELAYTITSGAPGLANSVILATEFFAKTITLTYGNNNISVDIVSPAQTGVLAHAVLSIKGFQKIECSFTTGGSATSCNALISQL